MIRGVKWGLVIGLLAIWGARTAHAQAGVNICPTVPVPVVTGQIDEQEAVVRHDLSMAELTRRGQEQHQIKLDKSTTRLGGLTDSNIRARSTIRFLFHQRTDRPEGCLAVGGVDIDLSLAPTIFIVREKKPNSCAYRETFAHEQKHVAVDRALIREYLPRFEDAVRDILAQQPPVALIATDLRSKHQKDWQQRIEQAINETFRDMQVARRSRQDAIDTPEEYQRVARACR